MSNLWEDADSGCPEMLLQPGAASSEAAHFFLVVCTQTVQIASSCFLLCMGLWEIHLYSADPCSS